MSILFKPYDLSMLGLVNRVVVPPMSQYSSDRSGTVRPWHKQHIGRLAISGAGMVIVEANAIAADGRITPQCLGLYTDEQQAAMTALLGEVRTYSATPIGVQLNHAGRKAGTNPPWRQSGASLTDEEGGWPTIAPSAIPYKPGWRTPSLLTEDGMTQIVDQFVAASKRAYNIGFDFVELHAANGYLLNQFLSPLSNTRTDSYGGSAKNRMRFPIRVAQALRAAWPNDRPLGIRFNGSDFSDNGLALEECVAFSRELVAIGFDYLSVSGGYNIYDQTPPSDVPGYMVPFAAAVKHANPTTTVITVGLIHEAQHAEGVLQSGAADLIAVGRAVLDDANWPIHAAIALGEQAPWPLPYDRFGPAGWPTHHHLTR